MQELRKQGKLHMKPDTCLYNTVVCVLARCGNRMAADRAEAILQKIIEQYQAGDRTLNPNALLCTSVISPWAQTGDEGGTWR